MIILCLVMLAEKKPVGNFLWNFPLEQHGAMNYASGIMLSTKQRKLKREYLICSLTLNQLREMSCGFPTVLCDR